MVAVIGTKDLIPPQGRVALELYDPDTGRVKKKVKAENAVMDWVGDHTALNQGRGPGIDTVSGRFYQSGLSPLQALIENGELPVNRFGVSNGNRDLIYQAGAWPWQVPPVGLNLWLWANESTATPNAANRHIPSTNSAADVVAGCYLGKQHTADGVQNKRGYLDLVSCERTWDRTRIVAEFLPGIGTGTYRSIGLGSLISQEGAGTPGGLKIASYPCKNFDFAGFDQYGLTVAQFAISTGIEWGRAGWDPDEDVIYTQTPGASTVSYRGDLKDGANGTYSHGFGTVEVGHAPLTGAGNFWIGYGQALYRGNRDAAIPYFSLLETVDISGSLGGETIRELTDNGVDTIWVLTDTRVFTFDAGGTKTITGNWLHGITSSRPPQFAYDAIHDCLWFTPSETATAADPADRGWGYNPTTGSVAPMSGLVSRAFTTAGADIPALRFATQNGMSGAGSATQFAEGPCTFFGNGQWFFRTVRNSTSEYSFFHANGSMASHALLPSDVVKDPTDALRITYDFNY